MSSIYTNKYNLVPPLPKTNHPTAKATTVKSVNQKSGRTLKEIQTKRTKQLSAGMAAWVKENRSKLKNPTNKQKEIFKQYDALKKEGRLPSTSTTKSRPSPQAQPSTSTKSAGTKPVQKQSRIQEAVKANKPKTGKKESKGTGVRGNPLPSNPKLKTQPPKSKLNRQQRRKKGLLPKRRGRSPADIAKSISDRLRLTYKKGELVRRGNKVYRSDGKGNLTLVHRKQF